MAFVGIKLNGVEEVKKKMQECQMEISGALPSLVYESALRTQSLARSKVNSRSGQIRREIKVTFDGANKNYAVAHVGIKAESGDAKLAIKVNSLEYGHAAPGNARGVKVVRARPFMRPSIKYERSLFKQNVETKFKEILDKDR